MAAKPKAHHEPGSGNVEIELVQTGGTLILRPTLEAGLAISRQAGGIRAAIDKVALMDIDTIVAVVRRGLGADEAKKHKNLDRELFDNGLMDADGEVVGKCIEFLTNLARGGRPAAPVEEKPEGEEAPAGE